jgi:hypothetical protein
MFSPWILDELRSYLKRISEDEVFYDTIIGTFQAYFSNDFDPNVDE